MLRHIFHFVYRSLLKNASFSLISLLGLVLLLLVAIGGLVGGYLYFARQLPPPEELAVQRAKESVFQPDWKKVFEPRNVVDQVRAIVEGRTSMR